MSIKGTSYPKDLWLSGTPGTTIHRSLHFSSLTRRSRAILRDPTRYANPDMFDPSRFLTSEGALDPEVPDPIEGFGYGRRLCAGRHFAKDIMWLAIANMLAVFEINESVDASGRVIKAKEEYTKGLFRCVTVESSVGYR